MWLLDNPCAAKIGKVQFLKLAAFGVSFSGVAMRTAAACMCGFVLCPSSRVTSNNCSMQDLLGPAS